jgi:hypothetical protein
MHGTSAFGAEDDMASSGLGLRGGGGIVVERDEPLDAAVTHGRGQGIELSSGAVHLPEASRAIGMSVGGAQSMGMPAFLPLASPSGAALTSAQLDAIAEMDLPGVGGDEEDLLHAAAATATAESVLAGDDDSEDGAQGDDGLEQMGSSVSKRNGEQSGSHLHAAHQPHSRPLGRGGDEGDAPASLLLSAASDDIYRAITDSIAPQRSTWSDGSDARLGVTK